jgi:hypothetical protein
VLDPAMLRMLDPKLLSNPQALLAFQQMFEKQGGGQRERTPSGMSPTFGRDIAPGNRMQNLQTKLDAFQDRFTKNGAQLTATTQKILGGVRWWNSLTNNAPKDREKPQDEPEEDADPPESDRPSPPPPTPPRIQGPELSSPETPQANAAPAESPWPEAPRVDRTLSTSREMSGPAPRGPNYPGPDRWLPPPASGNSSGNPFVGSPLPGMSRSLGGLGSESMTIPMAKQPNGAYGASRQESPDDEDNEKRDLLDVMKTLTEAILKLVEKLSGKDAKASPSGPGQSFIRGRIAPPRAPSPRPPENGNLVEPSL